jgi:hypothetical protein
MTNKNISLSVAQKTMGDDLYRVIDNRRDYSNWQNYSRIEQVSGDMYQCFNVYSDKDKPFDFKTRSLDSDMMNEFFEINPDEWISGKHKHATI